MSQGLNKRAIFIVSVIFSLALNLPKIVGNFHGVYSPALLFTDVDEPYYFGRALQVGAGLSPKFYYLEERDNPIEILDLLTHDLRTIPEYFVGRIGRLLKVESYSLGLLLDMIVVPLAFVSWGLFLGSLIRNLIVGLAVSGITMVFPWMLSVGRFFDLHFDFLENAGFSSGQILWEGITRFPSVPVLRGISTQISYPVVGIILFTIVQCARSGRIDPYRTVPAGILTGSLLYIYIFPFGVVALLAGWILLHAMFYGKFRIAFINAMSFAGTCVVCLVPYLFAVGSDPTAINLSFPELSGYYYLPPILLLQLLVALVLVVRVPQSSRAHILLWIYAGCSVVELCLMNLQPVVQVALAPYHFGELYLHPIGSATILLLLCIVCEKTVATKKLMHLSLASLSLISIIFPYTNSVHLLSSRQTAYQELFAKIKESTSIDSVVAITPGASTFQGVFPEVYSNSYAPIAISSITGRPVLYQSWAPSLDADSLKRELLLGWVYTGTLMYAWECPDRVLLPGDIFSLVWTTIALMRQRACQEMKEIKSQLSVCELLHAYKVDYLVVDENFMKKEPVHGIKIWQDSLGVFSLYALDYPSLLEHECRNLDSASKDGIRPSR